MRKKKSGDLVLFSKELYGKNIRNSLNARYVMKYYHVEVYNVENGELKWFILPAIPSIL